MVAEEGNQTKTRSKGYHAAHAVTVGAGAGEGWPSPNALCAHACQPCATTEGFRCLAHPLLHCSISILGARRRGMGTREVWGGQVLAYRSAGLGANPSSWMTPTGALVPSGSLFGGGRGLGRKSAGNKAEESWLSTWDRQQVDMKNYQKQRKTGEGDVGGWGVGGACGWKFP